jgi:4-diphosphocytidyl-2C-methyl-D-erythritol kinase
MAQTGPVWVRLCGSGSAIAAVYKKEGERDDAVQRLGEKHQRLINTVTRATAAEAPSLIT